MGGSLSSNNPVIMAAFHAALRRQAFIAALLLLVGLLALAARRAAGRSTPRSAGATSAEREHPGRRILRYSFGALWILDGLLQMQSAMPLGMPSGVVKPAAASSPGWVQHLVNDGLSVWMRHPIPVATSAVWIQLGIGSLILVAPGGVSSRAAGIASVYWAGLVWVFGEAFGGIFGSGSSWLFGSPGAVLLYAVAGLLIAFPERWWTGPRLGRVMVGALGTYFVAMAALQAWPGRGFWQGRTDPSGAAGGLTSMVQAMAQTAQPSFLSSLLRSFGSFDAAHGWAVNLVVVAALAGIGVALLSTRRRLVLAASVTGVVLCLADWVLVQDLGFLGGLGTDPNSMVPTVLLIVSASVAWLHHPAPTEGPSAAERTQLHPAPPTRLRPGLPQLTLSSALGATAATTAFGVILLGAVPMAVASARSSTDAILSAALNGTPAKIDSPAPAINLIDQHGTPVTLASFRGRTVALTFLDPVCTTDCPLIAQQFRAVDLGLADAAGTAFVAVVANPIYRQLPFVQAFDRQERLDALPNWYYLTGSLAQLTAAWRAYGIDVQTLSAGAMVAHSDDASVIDPSGHLRYLIGSDPGDTSSTTSSLGTLLSQKMRIVMGR